MCTDCRLVLRSRHPKIRDANNSDCLAEVLPRVLCPPLAMHSRHDAVHFLSETRKPAVGVPQAELVVLKTASVIPLLGQPEWPRMMQTYLDFLNN